MNGVAGRVKSGHMKLLARGISATALAIGAIMPNALHAQVDPSIAGLTNVRSDAPLLLQADELVYDRDRDTVAAVGNVQVDYDGNRLVAQRLVYNQRTGRLVAIGDIEIVQPDGTVITADEFDVTDDFAFGFVNTLRIQTPDRAYFAAENATREDGEVTTFNRGVYTACEPCEEHPEKPPVWQIKAQRIIWNGREKTVRFEDASFEFLGIPLARLPVFTTADPTVKRKTGFLAPSFDFSEETGFGATIPYFIALAPNYDLTLSATGYTRQGFLGEARFRHRLENGTYTLTAAAMHQASPAAFDPNTQDSNNTDRGMIGTTGKFTINPRWSFGWDVMVQSDKNFARTYSIDGFNQPVRRNEVYLTGLNDRNFFDARVMKIDVQETDPDGAGRDASQPWVLPSVDYNTVAERPVAGGELAFNVNIRGISRNEADVRATIVESNFATRGLDGQNGRITTDTEWRRTFVASGGLAVTPIVAAQTDAIFIDTATQPAYSASGAMVTSDSSYYRAMVTAGLEVRWPILFSTASSTHVLEPIAQVFARPDEMGTGMLPNEDAQSFVFDTTTLLERDKFSGYDRVEGGHRANLGLRYTGAVGGDVTLHGLFGQSYHLGGTNPFAEPDLLNVGAESGLESDISDYVGMFGVSLGNQFNAAARARFDDRSFTIRRAELEAQFKGDVFSASGEYAYIQAQPTYGFLTDRQEVSGRGSVKLHEYWQVHGYATYDMTSSRIAENGISLAYDDECFGAAFTFRQSRDDSDVRTNSFGVRISLRTLGDLGAHDGVFFKK